MKEWSGGNAGMGALTNLLQLTPDDLHVADVTVDLLAAITVAHGACCK